jgi:hypothetical protein
MILLMLYWMVLLGDRESKAADLQQRWRRQNAPLWISRTSFSKILNQNTSLHICYPYLTQVKVITGGIMVIVVLV